jgi:RNA polymerase sigma factor (sigma-70 family)
MRPANGSPPFGCYLRREQFLKAIVTEDAPGRLSQKLERIFEQHYELIYRTAYSLTGSTADAEDIVQTIFVRLLARELPPDLSGTPERYLYRAAFNLSLNAIRDRKRQVPTDNIEAFDTGFSEDDAQAEDLMDQRLHEAIAALAPAAAQIVILRYVHNYSLPDIARMLGTTRSTVAVSLFRSRAFEEVPSWRAGGRPSMKPEERKDNLDQALGRLGNVSTEVLEAARERIRHRLKAGRRLIVPRPPLPDATSASLAALHRPFFAAGAVLVCIAITIGAVIRLSPGTRDFSKTPPQSAAPRPQVAQLTVVKPEVVKPDRPPVETRLSAPSDHAPVPAPSPEARFTLLPPGDGRLILDRACGDCHRAAAVGTHHFATRAEYAALVTRMIGLGAPVSERDADVLVDYLFDNLGIKPQLPVESAGRAILERACTTCHSLNGIEKYAYGSEDPYTELVSTMVSYGAILSDEEKTTLVQYLFATYGKR